MARRLGVEPTFAAADTEARGPLCLRLKAAPREVEVEEGGARVGTPMGAPAQALMPTLFAHTTIQWEDHPRQARAGERTAAGRQRIKDRSGPPWPGCAEEGGWEDWPKAVGGEVRR